jgi:hypothetical protein
MRDDHPCAECPFARRCAPGGTGGSDPAVYVGQIYGPFLLNCHMDPAYKGNERSPDIRRCAGARIFRTNLGVDQFMPSGLPCLPADPVTVFATAAQLIAHHRSVSLEEAKAFLKEHPPRELLQKELMDAGVQLVRPSKGE